jgi:hypothetical protein
MTMLTNQLTKDVMGLTKTDRALFVRQLIETLFENRTITLGFYPRKKLINDAKKLPSPLA